MSFLKLLLNIGVVILCFNFFLTPAFAQVAVVEAKPDPKGSPFGLHFGYGYLANTDLKRSQGDFHRNSFSVRLDAVFRFGSNFKVNNRFLYEYHNYTFSGSSPFQYKTINRFDYAATFLWQASKSWTLMAVPILQWSGEKGADVGDSFNGGGLVGFNWASGPNLSLGFLIGIISQIENNALLAPIPFVHWRFAESWVFRVGAHQLGATIGLGSELAWQLGKTVELAGGAQFQRMRFRTDRNDQVAQETSAPIYFKGKWWFSPEGRLEIFASLAAGGKLRLENKTAKRLPRKTTKMPRMLEYA